jgi:uncharacterized protein (TIRG00374 family)
MLRAEEMERMPIKWRKYLSFSVKLAFTLLILYFVLSSVPVDEYQRALALLTLKPLFGILLLVLVQVFLLACRWYLLAKAGGSHLSVGISVYGILMSFFFSQGLPASVGGDAFRIWWHKREGIATGTALKIIFFDRIYGLLSLISLCFLSLFLLMQQLGTDVKVLSFSSLVVLLSVALGLLIMPWRLGLSQKLHAVSAGLPAMVKKILRWIATTRTTLSQQKASTTVTLLGLGIATHLLVVLQVFVVGAYLDPEKISLLMCLAVVPPALLVSYMPFSIAGWGVREASMVVAFSFLGVQASTAIVISIVIGMAILAMSLVGGLLWMTGGFRAAYMRSQTV